MESQSSGWSLNSNNATGPSRGAGVRVGVESRAAASSSSSTSSSSVDAADDIEAIETFYERLCHLVERQRVSDPLSVSIVHKVKSLLERGVGLKDKAGTFTTHHGDPTVSKPPTFITRHPVSQAPLTPPMSDRTYHVRTYHHS